MNRTTVAGLAVAGSLSLAACSSTSGGIAEVATTTGGASAASESNQTSLSPTTPAPSSAAADLPEPTLSARGNAVKQIGEPAYLVDTDSNDVVIVQFTVDQIEVDPQSCGPYTDPVPDGMHRIVLHMSIETKPELANDAEPSFQPTPYLMRVIGTDGITENNNSIMGVSCYETYQQLGGPIGPAQKVVGVVELQSNYTSGVVAFLIDGVNGWEWNF